jgi:hypothetical protein
VQGHLRVPPGRPSESNDVLKGGRRRNYHAGYCQDCWTSAPPACPNERHPTLPGAAIAVLAMLDTKIADDAERRDFAQALGLVGEPA